MDPLTKEIVAILRRDGRASYSDIARELGTTRDNVANRVNPLFRSEELRVVAAPNPRVLGLTVSAHLSIRVTGDPHDVARSLEQFTSLAFLSIAVGAFQIMAETELRSMSELGQQVSKIRALRGVSDVQVLLYDRVLRSFFLGSGVESFDYKFDEYDLEIIYHLQQDGRISYARLAKHVGLSLSGCRVRVQRMLESGVMQIGAIQQRSDMTDLLFGMGLVVKNNIRDATGLLDSVPGLEFLALTIGRFDMVATLNVNSLHDLNELASRLLALPSVSYCELWLHSELVRERYEHTIDLLFN